MINRNVDIDDLSNFDMFNDAKDTAGWLRRINRPEDAEKLLDEYQCFLQKYSSSIQRSSGVISTSAER